MAYSGSAHCVGGCNAPCHAQTPHLCAALPLYGSRQELFGGNQRAIPLADIDSAAPTCIVPGEECHGNAAAQACPCDALQTALICRGPTWHPQGQFEWFLGAPKMSIV